MLGKADLDDPTDGSHAGLFRGFILRNSDVGAAALTLDMFLYRRICGNNLIWGFQHVAGFRRRHVPDAMGGNLDLLLAVTPHVEMHHSTYAFLEELDRLVAVSPQGIRDVLWRFVETHEPFYDYQDRLSGLVSRLADLGFRADAISLCEKLRSMPGLRDLFMKLTSEEPTTGGPHATASSTQPQATTPGVDTTQGST